MRRRIFRKLISALAAGVLMFACGMPACAREIDETRAYLEIKNAPEGTTVIEILVPEANGGGSLCETRGFTVKKIIDHCSDGTVNGYQYHQPADKEKQDIVISKDSEIAQYADEDGYFSLSAHTDGALETVLNVIAYDDSKTEKNNGMYLQIVDKNAASLADIKDLEKRFGKFKAAYIDEKGNILGVTDEFEVTYDDGQYAFKADGNKLTLVMNNYAETVKSLLLANLGFPIIIFIAVLAVVFIVAIALHICAAKKDKDFMQDDDI